MRTATLAVTSLLLSAPAAHATWSIILVDTTTGEIAVGSATCLANFDLRAGTPVLIPGVGAATAQSFVDSTGQNRVLIRDRLSQNISPSAILAELSTFDPGHQTRQYGIADAHGNLATFSGAGAGDWAGGLTGLFASNHLGRHTTIAYAIQGNVLTGEPVVTAALQAITTTDGDLAARLMAGMQAARAMGGDGRCSCAPATPTACGAPPPSFEKSAHIAYMLIARAGDREGSNGIYRAAQGPVAIAIADINADARPDLLTANVNSSSFSAIANTTPPGAPFPTFGPLPTNFISTGAPRGLAAADINGDSLPDVLTANSTAGAVMVFRALPGGGFPAGDTVPTGAFCRAVAVANFDANPAPDLAAANFNAGTISIRANDGAGNFSGFTNIPVDAGPTDIIAAGLAGSPARDLAVVCRNAGRLLILTGDGAGGFAPHASLPIAAGGIALAAADIDADGDNDLAIACDAAQQLQVFKSTAGTFEPASYPLGFVALDVAAGDVNGDNLPDLVATGGNKFAVLLNTGAGAFTLDRTYTVAGSLFGAALADLDADGDLDLAATNSSLVSAMVVKNLGPGALLGTFNDGIGCATGDYWMNFNIAFQQAAAPDPVLQLQSQYDAWRTSLSGRPDAVQSIATLSHSWVPPGGTSTLTITLRDWQGLPITAPMTSVEIDHAPGSPSTTTIGPVTPQGGGVYTAAITALGAGGGSAFRITVDDGLRPVSLMPDPRLWIHFDACYADCDHSLVDPALNVADFTCFLQNFAVGHPYANCDNSTTPPTLNIADFTCFLQHFAAACP